MSFNRLGFLNVGVAVKHFSAPCSMPYVFLDLPANSDKPCDLKCF